MRTAKSTKGEATRAPKATKGKPAGAAKADKAAKPPKADDAQARGDRSKRLLDLVMILLRARTPVTYREVRDQFPAYQTLNAEDDSLEDGGYVIDLKRFKMPEVRLTPDEISALVLAASVAHAMPGGTYPKIVDLALKKLAFDLPELPDTPTEFPRPAHNAATVLVHFPGGPRPGVPPGVDLGEIYATLEAATRLRKRVRLRYQAAATGMLSDREVDPYAMVYREGAWLVVGWCHLRREIRSFRVDRIREAVTAPKPKSPDFERPADFDVKAYATRSPWTFASSDGGEGPEEIQLAFSPEAAEVANEDFGPTAVKRVDHDRTLITFDCGNFDFATSRVLAAKGAIRVLRGDRLRARIAAELDAIATRYADLDVRPELPGVSDVA